MGKIKLRRDDLIYPDLSYKIVGCAFEVYNEIGPGQDEKFYQKAMAVLFEEKRMTFKQQVYYPLKFKGRVLGRNYLDFVLNEKVVVELKKRQPFSKAHIDQVFRYLKVTGLQLAILITFGTDEVTFKRILNEKPKTNK